MYQHWTKFFKVTIEGKDLQLIFEFESHRSECLRFPIDIESEDFTFNNIGSTSTVNESSGIEEAYVVALSNNSNTKETLTGRNALSLFSKKSFHTFLSV